MGIQRSPQVDHSLRERALRECYESGRKANLKIGNQMESHFQALALAAYHRQSFDPDWFEDWLGVVWMPGSVVRDQRVRDLAARYGLEINLCNEYAAECAGVIGQPLPVSMAITNSWIRRPVKKNKLPHGTVYVITDAALEAVVEDEEWSGQRFSGLWR